MRTLCALVALALAAPAAAQVTPFPSRSGESGLLDVPDADVIGATRGALGAELRLDGRGTRNDVGALPLYLDAGIGTRAELGLSMRQGGQPGDPVPAQLLFGSALKLNLVDGSRGAFSAALDGYVDRLNADTTGGTRALLSSAGRFPVRVATFVGYEWGTLSGLTWGAALSALTFREGDIVLEALDGPRGANFGAAIRRRVAPNVPMFLAFNYFPGDEAWRLSVGFTFAPRRRETAPAPTGDAAEAAPAPAPTATAPRFVDGRPHFRLKLRGPDASGLEPRSLRHGPWQGTATASASTRPGADAAAGVRSGTPSLEVLAEAQVREQEALAETRDRRARGTADQLDAREKALADETKRLADRERDLAAREQQLDVRERRLPRAGAPTQQQRDLEGLEAQLASQERNLSAQERSFGPAVDAAQGRERDAAAREDAERAEASRLAASVSAAGTRAQQLDVRKQALGARNRQLAALETRLVARGERIDAVERQLRARAERLDTWQRRLDARGERLDLLEQRSADAKGAVPVPPKGPAVKAPVAAADKAIFVMVVKSPTAIVKERGTAPAGDAAPAGIQPGSAVEKAVAAATVVTFPSPAAQLSELDREAIDNIARLAARERCELLIWARAKDPGLMAEAQRRAGEVKTRILAVAPLPERQIVTRITTRPGAQGVDVVVSALRESARPAAPAAPAPAGRAGQLEPGEAGKRQLREAVQAAQPSIEACVGELMEQRKLTRAEGTLKLTLSAAGKVTKVVPADGDLAATGLSECLGAASGGWTFPPSDADYTVDVPITVIRGGAR